MDEPYELPNEESVIKDVNEEDAIDE